MRVLSWNLYHGRDFPPNEALFTLRSRLLRVTERDETHVQVNRSLCREFTGRVADYEWDVALLQEAPPLWFRAFRRRAAADGAGARRRKRSRRTGEPTPTRTRTSRQAWSCGRVCECGIRSSA